jgi:hypothetical protein
MPELCDESLQVLVPFLADIIRREEKRVKKIFNLRLCFVMSADASLLLGSG